MLSRGVNDFGGVGTADSADGAKKEDRVPGSCRGSYSRSFHSIERPVPLHPNASLFCTNHPNVPVHNDIQPRAASKALAAKALRVQKFCGRALAWLKTG